MTTQEKIEAIRQACCKVNREINHEPCLHGCLLPFHPHSVGLTDVLLAIKQKDVEIEQKIAETTGRDGCKSAFFYHFLQAWMAKDSQAEGSDFWNLLKPLENQEEPTISFIHDVLFNHNQ